jgi:hypothetical protein
MGKKSQLTADDIAVCIESHVVLTDSGEYSIDRGRRLRGDHPAVRANEIYFLRDGHSEEEHAARMREFDEVIHPFPVYHAPTFRPMAKCLKEVTWRDERGGPRLGALPGDLLDLTDPLVVNTPASAWRHVDVQVG